MGGCICGLGGPAARCCDGGATPFWFCGAPALGGTPGGPKGPPFVGPGGLGGPPSTGPCALTESEGGPAGAGGIGGIPLGLGGPIPGGPRPGRGGAAPGGPIGIPTGCWGIPLGPCCGAICCGAWNEGCDAWNRSTWSGNLNLPVASEAAPRLASC